MSKEDKIISPVEVAKAFALLVEAERKILDQLPIGMERGVHYQENQRATLQNVVGTLRNCIEQLKKYI